MTMLTYEQAVNELAKARNPNRGRKIANNTYLVPGPMLGDVCVRLHNTNVVTLHADGTYTLNSGGYRTVTTKERLNRFSPAIVTQKKHQWFVVTTLGLKRFFDGIWVDAAGEPVGVNVGVNPRGY